MKTIVINNNKKTNKQTHHLRVLMMRGVSEATHIPVQNPKPDARVRKLQYFEHLVIIMITRIMMIISMVMLMIMIMIMQDPVLCMILTLFSTNVSLFAKYLDDVTFGCFALMDDGVFTQSCIIARFQQ